MRNKPLGGKTTTMLRSYVFKKLFFPAPKDLGKNQYDLQCILMSHLILLGVLLMLTL